MINSILNLRYFLLFCITFAASFVVGTETQFTSVVATEAIETRSSPTCDETDDIYWETPKYLSKLEKDKIFSKPRYVYHRRMDIFIGDWLVSLNMMPFMDGYSKIYEKAISKYQGRERLLQRVIPTLNCLWNDVIFLSPLHPNIQYKEHKRIGFTPRSVKFFKIPIEVLEDKRVTVWKWLSYKKYSSDDPIRESIYSYCAFDFSRYQELDELPNDTKEFYIQSFDPANPTVYPRFTWYRIPHILCQDPIDLTDERITIINWEDDTEEE